VNLRKDHYRLTNYYSVVTSNPLPGPAVRRVPANVHFTREPGESHIGRTCHPCFSEKRRGVTSSRVRRRRFNDTGTPPVSRWRACSEARREEILLHAGAPRQLFNTLGLSTIERRTFHSFEMAAFYKNKKQFLAVDHSARASMKNAASCEN